MFLLELSKSRSCKLAWTFKDVWLKIMIQYKTRSMDTLMAQKASNHKLQIKTKYKSRLEIFGDLYRTRRFLCFKKNLQYDKGFAMIMKSIIINHKIIWMLKTFKIWILFKCKSKSMCIFWTEISNLMPGWKVSLFFSAKKCNFLVLCSFERWSPIFITPS